MESEQVGMPVEPLGRAFASTRAVLAQVQAAQLDAATPCASWDVRALIEHFIGSARWAGAAIGDGGPAPGCTSYLQRPMTSANSASHKRGHYSISTSRPSRAPTRRRTLQRLLCQDARLEAPPVRTWFDRCQTCVPFMRARILGTPGTWRMLPALLPKFGFPATLPTLVAG